MVPRGYSRRLQRVLVDFGAESAFAPAARRVREHYAIEVPVSAVRQHTLRHGKAIAAVAEEVKPRRAAKTLITEMDGSMVPIVHRALARIDAKVKPFSGAKRVYAAPDQETKWSLSTA